MTRAKRRRKARKIMKNLMEDYKNGLSHPDKRNWTHQQRKSYAWEMALKRVRGEI